uniref:2'-phosphotransferase n=1 Tax=Chaetoceros debilis TaxID=122233 RepID=A0A6S8Z148_9STRA
MNDEDMNMDGTNKPIPIIHIHTDKGADSTNSNASPDPAQIPDPDPQQKNKKARHGHANNNKNNKNGRKSKANRPQNTKKSTPTNNNGNNNNNKTLNTKTLSKALSWILRHGALKLNPPLSLSSDGYVPLSALLTSSARGMNSGRYTIEDIKYVVETSEKQRFKLELKHVFWYHTDQDQDRYRSKCKCKCKYSFEKVEGININTVEELCIRANQGHSIPNVSSEELLERIPSSILRACGNSSGSGSSSDNSVKTFPIIHGTSRKAWEDHIRHEGLKRMTRNHIHFATGLPDENENDNDNGNGVISGMRKSCQVYIYMDGEKCAKDDRIVFYKSDNGVVLTAGVGEEGTLPCRYFLKVVDAKTKENLMTQTQTKTQIDK